MSDYEAQRLARIAENRRRMAELGIAEAADSLAALGPIAAAANAGTAAPRPPRRQLSAEELARRREARALKRQMQLACVRRSRRHRKRTGGGGKDDDDDDDGDSDGDQRGGGRGGNDNDADDSDPHAGLLDVLNGTAYALPPPDAGDDASASSEAARAALAAWNAARCNAANRGSIYHSVGVSCHFCRQKKLCGEPGCPRCSRRSAAAECWGKSECSRCGGARGRFCRGCLWARYGEDLDDVRRRAARGEWICYHCQEEADPTCGVICNSSICMTRRGMKPTGAAAEEARARGFRSVAHWLQATLLAKAGRGGAGGEGGGAQQEEEGAAAAAAAAAAAGAPDAVPAGEEDGGGGGGARPVSASGRPRRAASARGGGAGR